VIRFDLNCQNHKYKIARIWSTIEELANKLYIVQYLNSLTTSSDNLGGTTTRSNF